jgi:predicted DNA-binding transcriptional regulator AlpA
LAELRRLTIREVCSLVGRSESSLREMIAVGRFPKPDYRDGPRCVRWSAGLVRRWLARTTAQA